MPADIKRPFRAVEGSASLAPKSELGRLLDTGPFAAHNFPAAGQPRFASPNPHDRVIAK